MKKENNNLKREMLKHKQLMIWARTGAWVTQSSLEETYLSDDIVILQQIEALKELRELYPKLAKDINGDLGELMTNPNATRIKEYNEMYATNMRNDIEEELVDILYRISILENANLTPKQRQLLLEIIEGYGYEGKHKDFGFMCKKIQKSKEKCKMSDKRKFTDSEMRKLFIGYYSKENDYWNEYLDYNRKLDCYIKDVAESKRKGDYYRSLSLQHSIFPLELDEVKSND